MDTVPTINSVLNLAIFIPKNTVTSSRKTYVCSLEEGISALDCTTFMLLAADRMEVLGNIRQMKVILHANSKERERERHSTREPEQKEEKDASYKWPEEDYCDFLRCMCPYRKFVQETQLG